MEKCKYKKYMNEIRQRKARKMYRKYRRRVRRESKRVLSDKNVRDVCLYNRLNCLMRKWYLHSKKERKCSRQTLLNRIKYLKKMNHPWCSKMNYNGR